MVAQPFSGVESDSTGLRMLCDEGRRRQVGWGKMRPEAVLRLPGKSSTGPRDHGGEGFKSSARKEKDVRGSVHPDRYPQKLRPQTER